MKFSIVSAMLCALVLGLVAPPAHAGGGKGRKKGPEAAFSKRDKNGDGVLSEQEFAGKKGGPQAEARFARLDKNKDGNVSLAEIKAGPKLKEKRK